MTECFLWDLQSIFLQMVFGSFQKEEKEGRRHGKEKTQISLTLAENESVIRTWCENCDDIQIRPMKLGKRAEPVRC